METIWKWELEVTDRQTISMPTGTKILCVQTQNSSGKVCIWGYVPNTEAECFDRVIAIYGTGNNVRIDNTKDRYIGTIQLAGGTLVFHVYEKVAY